MTELFFFLGVCVEADYIRPTCGRIGTLEIMLDGISENIGLTFPIRMQVKESDSRDLSPWVAGPVPVGRENEKRPAAASLKGT